MAASAAVAGFLPDPKVSTGGARNVAPLLMLVVVLLLLLLPLLLLGMVLHERRPRRRVPRVSGPAAAVVA